MDNRDVGLNLANALLASHAWCFLACLIALGVFP